ncbi:MBL fold metallo-hydrolase [Phyllobacterium bourgognense]|uniref:Glyoxylase-like metal-dependent hydrolase (Beta-lactamase superfamily II) n=1 Tax=Phyllobacterium bourgognense TaxID=314236 RepID=A0A368YKV5_9HYPH|nr:MBL fold metallo-hydrolase [Phyllobacterium bourgognense]RCW79527.1 glyoxylase-like metal-dependent hydrolase (beta-lactamase superfamily II) [Phyllobacterium bourgognense]
MPPLGSTMRIHCPYEGIYAFYDGRIDGARAYSEAPNWLDDGAYSLGVCTYAIVSGDEALVYDTSISLPHAKIIRKTLEDAGASNIRVVLSHWHVDHIAGNEVFADCEIIANGLTAQAMRSNRERLKNDNPPIKPLIMPNSTFEKELNLKVGDIDIELRHVDIHSHDGTMLILPQRKLMLAGDALEEPITYVAEPKRLEHHLRDLERMATWDIDKILPNHGAEDMIIAGGYGPELIAATRNYVTKLLRLRHEPELAKQDLRTFAAEDFASGAISYYAAYESVHARNVSVVLKGFEEA